MELRRFTMSNPTAAFSIVAHEAWGHKISDGENDEDINQNDGHNSSQRSRRRLRGHSDQDFKHVFINQIESINYTAKLAELSRVKNLWDTLMEKLPARKYRNIG
ncbi:unnamed protein product [Rotaria sp. Silwood1]|nr:unnamed protein product [Rotaria sp. Silwood1]CAF1002183.1 unnamed protein product [Rotaria sp. Silwood1]